MLGSLLDEFFTAVNCDSSFKPFDFQFSRYDESTLLVRELKVGLNNNQEFKESFPLKNLLLFLSHLKYLLFVLIYF